MMGSTRNPCCEMIWPLFQLFIPPLFCTYNSMRLERKIVFLSPLSLYMCICSVYLYTHRPIYQRRCVCVCTDRRRGVKCYARYIIIPSVQRFLFIGERPAPPLFSDYLSICIYYDGQIIEIFLLLLYFRPEEKFGDWQPKETLSYVHLNSMYINYNMKIDLQENKREGSHQTYNNICNI